MKMQITRILCLVLALLIAGAIALTSCSDGESGSDDPANDENPNTSDIPDEVTPEEQKILPDLPATSFGGKELHCLHWNLESFVGGGWVPWEEIDIDNPTGDTLDDQVYNRNAYVEETYDAVISTEYAMANTEVPAKIRAATATNDDTYQFMVQRAFELSGIWMEGLFMNLRGDDMYHIDFDKPWWNENSLKTFTFGGVTQFATSDMLLLDKSATGCIFFSTELQRNYELPNYYQMVDDGTWTWEALCESAEAVTDELNGDDIMDSNDQWGSAGNRAPFAFLYVGAGHFFAEIDESGYIFSNLNEENEIDLIAEIHDEMIYQDFHVHCDVMIDFGLMSKFKANELLFAYYSVAMSNQLRDMDTNYGILPLPKYDEYQEEYYHLIMPDSASVMGVPISCGDAEFTAFLLEAISAESYYTVYPTFYDVIMMGRYTRDQQSRDMLEIIFDTRTFDIGTIFGLGGVYDQLVTYAATGADNYGSLLASNVSRLDQSIEQFNDLIDQWQ